MPINRKAVTIAHDKRVADWLTCKGKEEASTLQIIEWYEAAKTSEQPVDSAWEDVHLRVFKDDQYKGPGHRCISYKGVIYKPEREMRNPTICGFCQGLDGRHYTDCPYPTDIEGGKP